MNRTYIVAELSANHGGSLDNALATIRAFAEAGADAIKIQTYKPESLCMNIDNEYFGARKSGLWAGKTLWELYSEAATPYEWHPDLQAACNAVGVDFFSTPFDSESVDLLASLDVPRYKIASLEVNDLPLIRRAASQGKPMIISTGLADQADIQNALDACYDVGNRDVTLLKCTSSYPATIADANLLTIPDMASRFGVPVGLSDHTLGHVAALTAVALGAIFVEKHVVLDRAMNTADAAFSMEPDEFRAMVEAIREVEQALGEVSYRVSEADQKRKRSLFAVRDLDSGHLVSEADVRSLRFGGGISPGSIEKLAGRRLRHSVKAGTPVHWNDLDQ